MASIVNYVWWSTESVWNGVYFSEEETERGGNGQTDKLDSS